jgi:Raf kinase inhibitor-like YbhB/YbcL family protein
MKKILLLAAAITLVASICYAQGFTLKSPDINGQLSQNQVLSGFGCKGQNISPELNWQNPPKNTKSFAVTAYDPDAPTGSGWWHWIVFDIPKDTTSLKSGAGNLQNNLSPKGSIQSITDFGSTGYGGACPPSGDKSHRYIFTVYALDIEKLGVNEKSSPAMVGFFLNQHSIAKSSVIAYYSR